MCHVNRLPLPAANLSFPNAVRKKRLCAGKRRRQCMKTIYLLLDNIRSVHNVGSIFRTAETLGISKIYCVGTTPVPIDRFGRKRKDFAKVALGTENMVAWEYIEEPKAVDLIEKLKKEGFQIIALEQAKNSIDYKKIKIKVKGKTLVILGNEVDGVSKELLKLADVVAEIPVKGKKESLNVSVAAGIALFRMFD
jgi:tRNA G18 (ribose-2'-O)-methylase SpoU